MARNPILRQNTINQFITSIRNSTIPFPLPSISILADMFNVSRTTIRGVLSYLEEKKIIKNQNGEYQLIKIPTDDDHISGVFEKKIDQDKKIEQFFYSLIHYRRLIPGDKFSEIKLAQQANVSPVVVREFLLRFLHYGLINNVTKGEWELIIFNKDYAEKLYEFRSILEIFALRNFLKQPADHICWIKAKELLQRHQNLQKNINHDYILFSTLDREFHHLILSANDNPFFVQSFDLISVVFHFHYQWDNSDLKERNVIAISEHIAVLSALLKKNEKEAIDALCKHLNTAKKTMRNSLTRNE